MKPTNWKTNTLGIAGLVFAFAQFFLGQGTPQEKMEKLLPQLAMGTGLLAAKDHDK